MEWKFSHLALYSVLASILYVLIRYVLLTWWKFTFYTKQGLKVDYFYPYLSYYHIMVQKHIKQFGDPSRALKLKVQQDPKAKAYLTNIGDDIHLILLDPDIIKDFFTNKSGFYVKTSRSVRNLKRLIGEGLVFSEGEIWKKHRRVLSSAFTFDALQKMAPFVQNLAHTRFADITKREKDENGKIKIYAIREFERITGDAVVRSFFGTDFSEKKIDGVPISTALGKLLADLSSQSMTSLLSWIFGSNILKLGLTKRDREIIRRVNEMRECAQEAINQRKKEIEAEKAQPDAQKSTRRDMLQIILDKNAPLSKDHPDYMNDREIIDEFMTFFAAGLDTTANLITHMTYFLSRNPNVQQKVLEEIKTVLKGKKHDDEWVSQEVLSSMKYLEAVVNETLRLLSPSGNIFTRVATEDHELGDLKIKKGTTVLVPVGMLHCLTDVEDTFTFRPERWLGDEMNKQHPFTFVPFSAGLRNCIGQHFARQEAMVVVTEFIRNFEITSDPDFKVRLRPRLSVGFADPFMLYLQLRA
eukprot:TRINITY_DN4051_c0_g1_i1.p1 TRINITY_DN4051_c0_g1~~TRINITY_DN4051_c0_g1_i1.p1  ORF type:complete len:526 (-),score=108.26 TRINITY_DN4051_c0_g1_i1:29-1606(-)